MTRTRTCLNDDKSVCLGNDTETVECNNFQCDKSEWGR